VQYKLTNIIAVISLLSILASVVFVITVIEIEKSDLRSNQELASYKSDTYSDSRVLVVYFSRSGNTELMAMEIAKHYDAHLTLLEAEDYRIGLRGWINALKDSQTRRAVITPERVDLSQYDTIFIGSPIWWYSPAPPVWQFVESNEFSGKEVILFNTFNSRFKQEYIDDFKTTIEDRDAHFINHIYVKRGRMTNQMSTESMLQEVRKQLNNLKALKGSNN